MSDAGANYSLETICKLLDLTPRRVQQLTNESVIIKSGHGKYDLVRSVRGYIAYLRTKSIRLESSGDGAIDGAAEKARLDKARADLAELDLAVKEGRLVPSEQIEEAWGSIATAIRTRLLSIPSSVVPRINSKMTTVQIESVIREQIDDALNAISGAVIVTDDDQDAARPGAGRRGGKGAGAVQGDTEA